MNSFDELKETVRRLRAEDGCPWDREQTHATLKAPVIEESAEAEHVDFHNGLEKQIVIAPDGTDITETSLHDSFGCFCLAFSIL